MNTWEFFVNKIGVQWLRSPATVSTPSFSINENNVLPYCCFSSTGIKIKTRKGWTLDLHFTRKAVWRVNATKCTAKSSNLRGIVQTRSFYGRLSLDRQIDSKLKNQRTKVCGRRKSKTKKNMYRWPEKGSKAANGSQAIKMREFKLIDASTSFFRCKNQT